MILQLRKQLATRPPATHEDDWPMRSFRGAADIDPWLELRRASFAEVRPPIRDWNRGDFHREMLAKDWWRAEHLWLVEVGPNLVGSVTLARRGQGERAVAAVHWLMVHPDWRGRGIARQLMSTLEHAAWQAGYREVWLETHRGWTSAVKFYEAAGYERVQWDSGQ